MSKNTLRHIATGSRMVIDTREALAFRQSERRQAVIMQSHDRDRWKDKQRFAVTLHWITEGAEHSWGVFGFDAKTTILTCQSQSPPRGAVIEPYFWQPFGDDRHVLIFKHGAHTYRVAVRDNGELHAVPNLDEIPTDPEWPAAYLLARENA